MPDEVVPLTDEERAELEELRAQEAARKEAARIRAERAELERLRAQSRQVAEGEPVAPAAPASSRGAGPAEGDAERIRVARERGRQLMEPTDDLAMPLGQKIVLAGVAFIVVAIVVAIVFGGR